MNFIDLLATLPNPTWRDVQRALIIHTLARFNGNRTMAAKSLGISIRTIRNKITEFNLESRKK